METTTTEVLTTATTTATNAADAATRDGSWATQTFGEKVFSVTVFGLSTAASVAFAYYLFTDPARLTDVWEWTRSLPLLFQGVIWLLCLPWMVALWMWSMPWAFAVRIVLVLAILAFTEFLMYPVK